MVVLALEVILKGNYNLVGKAKESKTKTAYNDIFEVNETYFQRSSNTTDNTCYESKADKVAELNYQVL
jgi:thiol:disulfide interchange protein DsbD